MVEPVMKHNLIERYRQFTGTVDANPFDLLADEKRLTFPWVNESFKDNFKTIGTTKAGCFIGEFHHKKKRFIMWLDSEGTPNFPIATSEESFFSLLPWTTGTIYDIAFKIIMKADLVAPALIEHPLLEDYERILGIKRHPDPVVAIKKVIHDHKNELDNLIDN